MDARDGGFPIPEGGVRNDPRLRGRFMQYRRPRAFPPMRFVARSPSPPRPLNPNQLPLTTPRNYRNRYSEQHPWAIFIWPRSVEFLRRLQFEVVLKLSPEQYRPLGSAAYMSRKFARSLFAKAFRRDRMKPMPFIELQHIENSIDFRRRSEQILRQVCSGNYDDEDNAYMMREPDGSHETSLVPLEWNNIYPVLYQVVATGWGTGVILEAKDFFIFQPDRKDLHCIVLDQFAVNIKTGYRGFDKGMVSVRDFVWVYEVRPTLQALANPDETLKNSRLPRTTALTSMSSQFFFRVAYFVFVTPQQLDEKIYGIVLRVQKFGKRTVSFKAVFEGFPEAVPVTPSICAFDIETVRFDEILIAESRPYVSCAVRFSEPPVSQEARDFLCEEIRDLLPMEPYQGVVPLQVYRLNKEEQDWLRDRAGRFENFALHPKDSKHRMTKLLNVASSALGANARLNEDRFCHLVDAIIPNSSAYPMCLTFRLFEMTNEAGWTNMRAVIIHVIGANFITCAQVRAVEYREDERMLIITISAFHWNHRRLTRAVTQHAVDGHVEICVKLGPQSTSSNPIYDIISRTSVFEQLSPGSRGDEAIDAGYGRGKMSCANKDDPVMYDPDDGEVECVVNGRRVELTLEQRRAVALGLSRYPLVGIQAAFGTGKTLIGALIAATSATSAPVIVVAQTNAAVAHFTNILLSIGGKAAFPVRYLADTAAMENAPRTPVDLNVILKQMDTQYSDQMEPELLELCREFREARELMEKNISSPDFALQMTEENKEEYMIADRCVSRNMKKIVRLKFRLRKPKILLATVASILNTTASKGLLKMHVYPFKVLICDEASQIPESALAALAMRLPDLRHAYIGDKHQLQPHTTCSRDTNPVIFGAKSVMSVLENARAVPIASLCTTFRSHPELIELPDRIAYDGQLRSTIHPSHRRMLLDVMRFSCERIPFMFINFSSTATRAQSKSLYNPVEADICWRIVSRLIAKGIPANSICIVSFYREQYRRMRDEIGRPNVEIATVDSLQGREKDVIILHTTRTEVEDVDTEFFDDYRRLNVAVTRCRHGQFILGNAENLSTIPSWSKVANWADSISAIIPSEQLDRYLPARSRF